MGAPSVNLKQIIIKITRDIDKNALRHSALFYVPSLATTLVSFLLFSAFKGFNPYEHNKLQVIIMASIIVSLVSVAGIQFLINKVVGEASQSEDRINQKTAASGFIKLAVIISAILSIAVSVILYKYFNQAIHLSALEFLLFVILGLFYSVIWVLTAAFWAWGLYKYPAIIYVISYFAIFIFSYFGYRLSPSDFIIGYACGVALLVALLSFFSWKFFRGKEKTKPLIENARKLPNLIAKNCWGILFQTFFILAIFLDKIIVWISEGVKVGTGIQFTGVYTTGAFLGLIPTFSLVALAYFTEKVKPLSKGMYSGTLQEMRNRIQEYKQIYTEGLITMLSIGFGLLAIVVILGQLIIRNTDVTLITLTIGVGTLFFEVILFNAFILPVFHKSHISAIAMFIVCLAEISTLLLVRDNVWFASLGFLVGSEAGLLLSHVTTRKMLAEFDYNAFRAFQLDN
jgi:hypothetical protein